MQKISTNLISNSRTFMVIVTVLCLFALLLGFTASLSLPSGEIVAEAATTITASNFHSVIRNSGNAGTVSGDFVLTSDISLAVNSGRSIATFSGTLDGQGHTITINSGSVTHTMSSNVDQYVGFFFGTLSGSIKNVNIVLNGSFNAKATNNKATSGDYTADNNTTLYVGIIAGYATSAAKIEGVSFTIGDSGVVGGVGIDGSSDHERYSSGQGAVVGGMIGRSAGATFRNITFTNNGSVWARGHNYSAGQGYKGTEVKLNTPLTRGDRAAAGGMIGEIERSTTTISSLIFRGTGYVGAWATGGGDSSNTHNLNYAGGIIGFTYGGSLSINGMLYEYEGKAYVKEILSSEIYAGTILGKGSNVTVTALWRRTDDNSKNSGTGINTAYSSTTAGPAKSSIINNTTTRSVIGTGTITSVATCTSSTLSLTPKEYKPTVYYNGSTIDIGSATITDIKDGYLTITAISNDPSYIISAAAYNTTSGGQYTYKNYYTKGQSMYVEFTGAEYQIPVSCYEFRVMLATMEKTLYTSCQGDKTYDTYGLTFTGAPTQASLTLLSNLYWAAEHDSDASNNRQGSPGSAQVTTSPNVGTYTMVLYKLNSDGTSTRVGDGENLGANQTNAPTVIYQFDASKTYSYTISRAEIELVQLSGASYTREYNGNASVDGNDLELNVHYGFYLAGTTNTPRDNPEFTIGSGYFYNASGVQDGSVGTGKTVKIEGINVTGNYVLAASSGTTLELKNCSIVERKINVEWGGLSQTYNGSLIKPSISATNLLSGDSINFTVTSYASIADFMANNPLTDKTNVGTFIAVATIADNPNYELESGYVQTQYTITAKEIELSWTPFSKTFNYTDQEVSCSITNASSVIAEGDIVNITIKYSLNGVETTLRNAGEYVATASIDNTNYYVNSIYTTFDSIKILPIEIPIIFYTGNDSTSNTVASLTYQGKTYIDDEYGLHAKINPSATSYGLIDSNIKLTYEDGATVKDVGSYEATASFVDSDLNENDDIIITNYTVSSQTASQIITIIEREVTLSYGTSEYVYDGTVKSIDATIDEGCIVGGDSVQIRKQEYVLEGSAYVETDPINAGSYLVRYTLTSSNYKIKTGYESQNLTITAYNFASGGVTIDVIEDQIYCGSAITPQITVRYLGQVMQTVNYTVSISNNTAAGVANVTVTGKTNYTGTVKTTFTINKKTLSVVFNSPAQVTYNGMVQGVNASFAGYAEGDNEEAMSISYSGASQTPITIGKYTATVSFAGSSINYKLSDTLADRQFSFEIIAKPVQLSFSGYSNLIFNGESREIKVAFLNPSDIYSGDNISLSLSYTSVTTGNTAVPRDAGTYIATAVLSGTSSSNYVISGSGDNYTFKRFEIAKYVLKVIFDNSTKSFVYNAGERKAVCTVSEETPELANEDAAITLYYRNSADVPITGNPINAGLYTVTASSGSSNYSIAPDTATSSLYIAKAPLTVILNMTTNTFTYEGPASSRDITYLYDDSGKPQGSDGSMFSLNKTYYDVNHTPQSDCINVGTYRIKLELPEDVLVAQNYELTNAEEIYNNQTFSITPRYLSVQFSISGNVVFSGEEMSVTASAKNSTGIINEVINNVDFSQISGLMQNVNGDYESVTFIVETKDENGEVVTAARNVGTYVSTVRLEGNANYVLYEDNQSSYPTTSTLNITQKNITFLAKNISKVFGDEDKDDDFYQELDSTVTGIEGESITVKLVRSKPEGEAGEQVGSYGYTGFSYDSDSSNFNISFAADTTNQGKFTINQRRIDFTPQIFYFNYLSPIENLVHTEKVSTPVFGELTVSITLQPMSSIITQGISRGTYDLSTTFTCDNANFNCVMNEGSNKGKIVVRGRSVFVDIPNITITYGDEEPNYYEKIVSVDYTSCAPTIQAAYELYVSQNGSGEGFDWSNYIRITREPVSSSLAIGLPYKENGYKLTIEFLRENALGNYEVDDNYRAVDKDGNDVSSRLYVQKFDLNTVFGPTLAKPEVSTSKDYDGGITASILNANIADRYSRQTLSVYAEYDNANAGEGKTITVKYAFRVTEYGLNYILPNDIVYTTEGEIKKLDVNVIINENDFTLTYGQTPSITLSYEGFINNDTAETEGISLSGVYADNVSLDTVRSVASYTVKLNLDTCLTPNYNVVYANAKIGVKVNPKSIAIVAGEAYEKPVDGTTTANITSKNYVIDGILAGDANFLSVSYTAALNSSEPGETTVRMIINGISGSAAVNYSLSNYELTIPAIIKKLADVTMANAVYDFDDTQKPVVPVLENVLDGVSYYLEYTGVNVQYSTSRQAPKNAGTYIVVCYVHNEQNTYNRALATAELTINKITPKLYFTGTFTQTYGSFTSVKAYVKASGIEQEIDVTYSFEEEGAEFPSFPPAGRHTIKASFAETSNYLDVKGEQTLLIKEKAITITFDNYKNLVYNGFTRNNDISVRFNGVVEGDTCEPVKLFNADEVKNAGTYRLIVSPSNKSYIISGSNSIEFTIGKKKLYVTVGNDTVTTVGVEPVFSMQYSGFVENENEEQLTVKPSVQLTSGSVGVNRVKYNEGFDENYTFEYVDCVYTITYQSKNEGKTNYTPYIAVGAAVGAIGLIFLIGYAVKIYNYRSMTKYVAKHKIKKSMMKDKNMK